MFCLRSFYFLRFIRPIINLLVNAELFKLHLCEDHQRYLRVWSNGWKTSSISCQVQLFWLSSCHNRCLKRKIVVLKSKHRPKISTFGNFFFVFSFLLRIWYQHQCISLWSVVIERIGQINSLIKSWWTSFFFFCTVCFHLCKVWSISSKHTLYICQHGCCQVCVCSIWLPHKYSFNQDETSKLLFNFSFAANGFSAKSRGKNMIVTTNWATIQPFSGTFSGSVVFLCRFFPTEQC